MTPAQRWMILGGAVVVVVILGVFIFFLDAASGSRGHRA
jgi:hypothetical protein